ncbi:ATP-dependent DNA helicase RecG, partial [Candidatus Saccharibacteria bacterium]|nr:ATP-dependent DNA helicase RecG [Candidatus Saccharibacteria bacterium]
PPMNRLLQGDVGSGKTIVAGLSAFVAARAGHQTAVMAPTEILAAQHAKTLADLLTPFKINVALLTGSVKGKTRQELLKQIENGSAQIVVGTHALFQTAVKFHKLGFAVIDEQHRFGVKQRQELLAKSHDDFLPHLLSMTATPIPRSLQLTVFGDLDISILNELPKGRQPIKTQIVSPVSRATMLNKIAGELENGRQVYFIATLIENSEKSEKENVANLYKKIASDKNFKKHQIGVLHGQQPAETKEKIMREFAANETQILVATTVVEVGVDVPNASVIVIENADQFGLSQLHQLRGRVGRGAHRSFCYLVMSDSSAPTQRLREIERSNDGFYLAEVDLKLRGAGEIYGTAQHGQLNLQIANLADTKLIKRAAAAATNFANEIGQNPETLLKYQELAREVSKYQRLTTLN